MSRFLFNIDEVINVRGRGPVLFPGPPRETVPLLHKGQRLKVVRRDKSELALTLCEVVYGPSVVSTQKDRSNTGYPLFVDGEDSVLAELETGSEVWID